MPGRHLPPDHSRGDANTLGGYAAVHARPAAFEGPDGLSYSVEILAEPTGEPARPWGAYLFFVRWARMGEQRTEGHLETTFLAYGDSEPEARDRVGALRLSEVRELLDALVRARQAEENRPQRKWWDVMREEGDE